VSGAAVGEVTQLVERDRLRQRRMLRATGVWGSWTLVARVAGFAREILMASAFGTTPAASALVVAQTVPNLARSLVSEEVARGALLPVVAEQRARGDLERSEALTWASAWWTTLAMAVVGAVVWLTASWSTSLLTPGGATPQLADRAAHLLRLLIPIILASGVGAASSALLVSRGRMSAASMPIALSNIPLVAALIFARPSIDEAALLVAGGMILQVALQLAFAWRLKTAEFKPTMLRRTSDVRAVASLALPVAIALGASAFSGLVDTAFSTVVGAGAPAALDKAIRLILVPYGMFAVAISVVAMPTFVEARLASSAAFDRELVRVVRLQASVLVPAGLMTGVLATPIVRLVYERGSFDAASTALTSRALLGMAFVLPAFGLSLIGSRAWLSQKKAWAPAAAMAFGIVLNGLLDWVLVGPLGVLGIGVATAAVHSLIGGVLTVTAAESGRDVARELGGFTLRLAVVLAAGGGVAMIVAGVAPAGALVRPLVTAVLMLSVLGVGARVARVDDYRSFVTAIVNRGASA
jgi:putative peptidoglycan lipid II flippase